MVWQSVIHHMAKNGVSMGMNESTLCRTKQCGICRKTKHVKYFQLFGRRKFRGHFLFPSRNCTQCRNTYQHDNDAHKKEYRQKNKIELLTAYGNGICACVCCGETAIDFLSLDHIGGKATRRILGHGRMATGQKNRVFKRELRDTGFPHKDKLRTLCMNCNFGTRYGRTCPHKRGNENGMETEP